MPLHAVSICHITLRCMCSNEMSQYADTEMLIRIPGPQILGYIQQLVPQDRSTAFDPAKSLASEFYLPPPLNKDLAKNTDTPAATSGTSGGSGANTLKTSNPTTASVPPAGFAFEVGKTKMSADDSEMTSGNTEAPKGGSLRGLEAPATKGQSAHPPRDAALDDVFKNIVDTLQGNDEALKAAVKKWLESSPDLGPPA